MDTPAPNTRSTDTPRRILRAIFEWRWSAIGFFITFFTFLMFIAYFWPPSYTAKASVLVKAGRENAPEGTTQSTEGLRLSSTAEDVISEINVMLARPVLDNVATRLEEQQKEKKKKKGFGKVMEGFRDWCVSIGLQPSVEDHERLIGKLSNKIKVELEPATNVLLLAYEDKSPATAQKTLQYLLEDYLDFHIKIHANGRWNAATESYDLTAAKFFNREAEQYLDKLQIQQEMLTKFRQTNLGGEFEKKRDLLVQELVTTEQALVTLKASSPEEIVIGAIAETPEISYNHQRLLDLNIELLEMEQQLRGLDVPTQGQEQFASGNLSDSPEISFYNQRLLDLSLQLAEKVGQYSDPDSSVEVRNLRNQIAATRSALVEQIGLKRAYLERRRQALLFSVETVKTDQRKLLEQKQNYLERQVGSLKSSVREVEQNQAELEKILRERDRLEAAYLKYKDKADEERISEALDAASLTNVKVLEWPSLPPKPSFPNRFMMALLAIFLGIPASIAVALLRAYFHGRVATVQDVEEILGVPVLASVPAMNAREHAKAFLNGMPDSVMNAARLSLASARARGHKVIHVASSTSLEGAGTLAAAMCLRASEEGIHVAFATPSGFPEELSEIEGVDILQLKDRTPEDQEKDLNLARESYDLIVLSGTPLAATDGGLMSSLADSSVFVVSGTGVHFEIARRGVAMLRRYSSEVLGAVLTRRRNPVPSFFYKRI